MKQLFTLAIILLFTFSLSTAQSDTTEVKKAAETTTETAKKVVAEVEPVGDLTVEAELCTGVEERMPVGMAKNFPADVGQVYLWCKVLGAKDTTEVYHVWSHNGEEMAKVPLTVKSNAYRTWSSKQILPSWTGDWTVQVTDESGKVLKELSFTVGGVN